MQFALTHNHFTSTLIGEANKEGANMSKWICKSWELPSVKAAPGAERYLKMPFSPGANGYEGATILISYVPPGSMTAMHSHSDSDEIMYFLGRGEAVLGDERTRIENDLVMVALKGVPHEVRNTSDTETLKVFCIFVPPVRSDPLYDRLAQKTREAMEKKP
jgi:mannose-6-phosphate isomerase-like protein (cupin superfamily)